MLDGQKNHDPNITISKKESSVRKRHCFRGVVAFRVRMVMKSNHLVLPFALLCLGAVHAGTLEPRSVQEPASLVAPEDKALIVFVRPKKTPVINFYVFDENKKLVTLYKQRSYATITAEPGKHTYYVVAENAKLVRADVVAGRTYVIHTYPRGGFGKARVAVEPLRRSSPEFGEARDWFRKTAKEKPDFEKGDRWTRKHQPALERRMTNAEEKWSKMDEKAREALTLRPDDGLTAEEAKALGAR